MEFNRLKYDNYRLEHLLFILNNKESMNNNNNCMTIIRFVYLIILCLSMASCATTRAKYRFSHGREAYCSKTQKYKARETTPFKYFQDHYSYHLSSYRKNDRNYLINQLSKYNMEYIQYRDIITVIVPVDQYFEFNSSKLDERQYTGLNNLVNLIYLSPCTTVHIAAFSDNVGTREFKNKLTQAQAEALLTYLWANDIPADYLNAQGFGTRFAIGENDTTRGSTFNRRIEVQWTVQPDDSLQNIDLSMK